MASPTLILRFRDAVDGVSGSAEHKRLIRETGSVFWGWWKKQFEDARVDILERLVPGFSAILISPNEGLQFLAQGKGVLRGGRPEEVKIPAYYRNAGIDIPVWFEFTQIEQTKYDEALGSSLSALDVTILEARVVDGMVKAIAPNLSSAPQGVVTLEKQNLLHISDLHIFTGEHNFAYPGASTIPVPGRADAEGVVTLGQAIADDLRRIKRQVGAVVVSGDIVSRGSWDQLAVEAVFKSLQEALEVPPDLFYILPGNHDFYRVDALPPNPGNYDYEMSFRHFRNAFLSQNVKVPLENVVRFAVPGREYELQLAMLNSARWSPIEDFYEYGFVGRDKYLSVLQGLRGVRAVKMLALHHHIVPVQLLDVPEVAGVAAVAQAIPPKAGRKRAKAVPNKPTRRPVSVTLDSVDLVHEAQSAGVSLILHGHQHKPSVTKLARLRKEGSAFRGLDDEDIYVCGAGTAGSRLLPADTPNSYSLLRFGSTAIELEVRGICPQGRELGPVLQASLPIKVR